jgi:uncharacterized protein YoxC
MANTVLFYCFICRKKWYDERKIFQKGVSAFMDWLGIGITLLGAAFLVLVILLIKPLRSLTGTLDNLKKTTASLPEQVEGATSQATEVIQQGNETLNDVNRKMNELNPLFAIIGNIGRTLNTLSSYIVDVVSKVNMSTTPLLDKLMKREHMEAILSVATLGYVLFQKKKQ